MPFTSGVNREIGLMQTNWVEVQAALVEYVGPKKLKGSHTCFCQIHLGIQIQQSKIIS